MSEIEACDIDCCRCECCGHFPPRHRDDCRVAFYAREQSQRVLASILPLGSKAFPLREAQDSATVQRNVSQGDPIADLEQRVAKMRELGVTKWGDIELGPLPPSEAASAEQTQRLTPAQQEQRAREERRRIASAASGGPLRRLADD